MFHWIESYHSVELLFNRLLLILFYFYLLEVCQIQVYSSWSCDKSVQFSISAAKVVNRSMDDMIKGKIIKYSQREVINNA
jgi:hypothetical protein